MSQACQVVPDIPVFGVDDGFTYTIPEELESKVHLGSLVRIRMSGRRTKGFVTSVFPTPEGRKLKPIDGVSGSAPLFDADLLTAARNLATHYITPMSTVLARTAPPNVPKHERPTGDGRDQQERRTGTIRVLASVAPHHRTVIGEIERTGPRPVIVPTVVEAEALAAAIAAELPDVRVVTAASSMSGAHVTAAWRAVAHDDNAVLVGTRETAMWRAKGDPAWIVVEDSRRVMKSPSTPTMHVRDVLLERQRHTGAGLTIISPVPSLESIQVADEVAYPTGRLWAGMDIADRTDEPPGSSLLLPRVQHAIRTGAERGQRVFVLVTSRGYAPAFRCRGCSALRRCGECGAALTEAPTCRRCGTERGPCPDCGAVAVIPLGAGIGRIREDIARFVAPDKIGLAEDDRPVSVGSERDLVGLGAIDLGVVVDIDGMLGAPHYRAAEDTLRLVGRLGQAAMHGGGGRVAIQTSDKDHPVLHVLASGHPQRFLASELEVRGRSGFPPIGELIAFETNAGPSADAKIRAACDASANVLGPAPMSDRTRWLISGTDLSGTRVALRRVVDELRQGGATVRVDADPIDL